MFLFRFIFVKVLYLFMVCINPDSLVYVAANVPTTFPWLHTSSLIESGNNVCKNNVGSGTELRCCEGWQNYYDDLSSCNHPICNGTIQSEADASCSIHYEDMDQVDTVKDSGGTCTAPGTCNNCNDGYYSNGTNCVACPNIENCRRVRCTSPINKICTLCDGEIAAKPYWRAYRPVGDTCQETCSWRHDSCFCFPGNIINETKCECVAGFEGYDCIHFSDGPNILYNQITLEDTASLNSLDNSVDVSTEDAIEIWINNGDMRKATVTFRAISKTQELPKQGQSSDGSEHFITSWAYGINYALISYRRKQEFGGIFYQLASEEYQCVDTRVFVTEFTCEKSFTFSSFKSNDMLEFMLTTKNGGFITVMNRENNNQIESIQMMGKTSQIVFVYRFDMDLPYQSCVNNVGPSCLQPIVAPDVTRNSSVELSWNDWTDTRSSIKQYLIKVQHMQYDGLEILRVQDNVNVMSTTLPSNVSSALFDLSSPGLYSILLEVSDLADNIRTARALVMFDDESKIEKLAGAVLRVTTASEETHYTWVVVNTNNVTVEFMNTFANVRHLKNHWLSGVAPHQLVDFSYDDHYGKRTLKPVNHVNGIVDIAVSYTLYSDVNVIKEHQPMTSADTLQNETTTVNVSNWTDGEKLEITIRATDMVGMSKEETLTVYRDTSPPHIENLWLTKGNRNNFYIHSVEEFTEMTFEWDTYDYHSGIYELDWKLYDNFTSTTITHGHENMVIQGDTKTLTDCQMIYGNESNHCYCTLLSECFHRHFTVIPRMVEGAGLIVNRDRGVHGYDYYFEVNVKNVAQLTASRTQKITIDVSPPHTGVVQEGVYGSPEVDFQQNTTLYAHWDGFFDKESGVKFYMYSFDSSCQDAENMVLDTKNSNIFETTLRQATHVVSKEGTYFTTVVAFNGAMAPSDPVCSDGVTVDTTKPSVKEITIHNASIRGRLVTDANRTNLWVLGDDRKLKLINNTFSECWNKATVVDDLDVYPYARNRTGSLISVDWDCETKSMYRYPIYTYLSRTSLVHLEWLEVNIPGGIYDYEIGISRTLSGGLEPDIMDYVSTHQNPWYKFKHTDLVEGEIFYFSLKSISKTGIEGIQNIGPCFVDTTAPSHVGQINIEYSGDYLIASWSSTDFFDTEDIYELEYSVAIGNEEYGNNIQNYKQLQEGGTCINFSPPNCTAIDLSALAWDLQGSRTYFVSIKVENTAGLYTIATSVPYIHDGGLASPGVVLEIPVNAIVNGTLDPYMDIEDIDFQTSTTMLAVMWSGFTRPHVNITYRVYIGTQLGQSDVLHTVTVGNTNVYLASGLNLTYFQTYFITVEAVTVSGAVNVSSDGITILNVKDELVGVTVHDGVPCSTSQTGNLTQVFTHHDTVNYIPCVLDVDFQASVNTMQAYWIIQNSTNYFIQRFYWSVEVKSPETNQWTLQRDFFPVPRDQQVESHDFNILPGHKYRSVIKMCAEDICYQPLGTDGVTILPNPPETGNVILTHLNTMQTGNNEKILVEMDRFFDPDIADTSIKYDVIEAYEWALTDNSEIGRIFTKWTRLQESQIQKSDSSMTFEIKLKGKMDFSRCKKFSIRGYNKANVWSQLTADVKSCSEFVIPNIVIDAIGKPSDGTEIGEPIVLDEGSSWTQEDADYTPYSNYMSAVWPTLTHGEYHYAVLRMMVTDITSYHLSTNQLSLSNPCTHPNAITGSCGVTDKEFVNIEMRHGQMVHGVRYMVCIHAKERQYQNRGRTDILPEVNSCTDGVVVDLTPPKPANVWIGHDPAKTYQTSSTHLYINWESFLDVEEFGTSSHVTGISTYAVTIGTSPWAEDVVGFTEVGVTNHKSFHNLHLQNGHKYYATVNGTDFAGRVASATSNPVVIDTTPPGTTDKPVSINGRHISSTSAISACWKEVFTDLESGIQGYFWAVGSKPGHDDIMSYTEVFDNECGIANTQLDFHEGHSYYVNVRAYNGAGLFTEASSWAYVADFTAPVKGHVYDGICTKDIDFQTNTSYIGAFWEGFNDPHSTLKEYWISIGTCKQCADVLTLQPIGIVEEFMVPVGLYNIGIGMWYYTSVTACNTADLCSTRSSDGVILDDTPPIPGVVQDGVGTIDALYQGTRTYVAAKWYAFSDPESGLKGYEWWAGTSVGAHDQMEKTKLHLQEEAVYLTISPLPLNTKIFITVRVYNLAGQFSQTTSNGFIVDITPPSVSAPRVSSDIGSVVPDTIVSRNSFKVTWSASDGESFIERQHLSITSHLGGEFSAATTKIDGTSRNHIFTDLDLHDGVYYYVTLIACNGAGLCSQAESAAILVDCSPPSRGMFAVNMNQSTDTNTMSWTNSAFRLSWIGFTDLHSGVDHYIVSVGTSYMANDLTENLEFKISHSLSGEWHEDGYIQSASISTNPVIRDSSDIYISMWAVNSVGLRSEVLHALFKKMADGSLELVKRCYAFSCAGHCVCAPQDQLCISNAPCIDKTGDETLSKWKVRDMVNLKSSSEKVDHDFTSSNNIIGGSWSQEPLNRRSDPLWFEWSLAFENDDRLLINNRIWQDAGRNTFAVFSLPRGSVLLESVKYIFCLRVWYTGNTYALFKSDGITHTRGIHSTRMVTENNLNNKNDADYVKYYPLVVNWKNTFQEVDEKVERFYVYLSTYPAGHAIHAKNVSKEYKNTVFSHFHLETHTKLYSNVIAYSFTGQHTTVSSDGFMIDDTAPRPGLVNDGSEFTDEDFTSQVNSLSAFWRGFTDHDSGIRAYFWCVGKSQNLSECDVKPWQNVGLRTKSSFKTTTPLQTGNIYFNKVYAVDNVGHISSTVISDGVLVDATPPVFLQSTHNSSSNLITNPSFEDSYGNKLILDNFRSINVCSLNSSYLPVNWSSVSRSCVTVVSSEIDHAKHGAAMVILRESIKQDVKGLEIGQFYRIHFVTSHIGYKNDRLASKEGVVKFAGKSFAFLLYSKEYRHSEVYDNFVISWHPHYFYVKATSTDTALTLGTVDNPTWMLVDDVTVQKVILNETADENIHFYISLHNWNSIHASWHSVDDESDIIDYQWAIGYSKGNTHIQHFQSVGLSKFAYNYNVSLVHRSTVYVTVIATNAAGLSGIYYSSPFTVDSTGPHILLVSDGSSDEDLDAWSEDDVSVTWRVEDYESGINFCEWAIGTRAFGNDIQDFKAMPKNVYSGVVTDIGYDIVEGKTVFSTVRCTNMAGLHSVKSSDGVRISEKGPSATHASIQTAGISRTEYPSNPPYQSANNEMKLTWTGFTDVNGIDGFIFSIEDENRTHFWRRILSNNQEYTYVHLTKLSLTNGKYNVTVSAQNSQQVSSTNAFHEFTVSAEKPIVDASKDVSVQWKGITREITVTWDGVFFSEHPISYEISAGTQIGSGDVVQWIETTSTSISFKLPLTILHTENLRVYIIIRAVSVSGVYSTKFTIATLK